MKWCTDFFKGLAINASRAMLALVFVAIQVVIVVGLFAWGASQYGFDKMLTVVCVGIFTAALEVKLQAFSQIVVMEKALWMAIREKK